MGEILALQTFIGGPLAGGEDDMRGFMHNKKGNARVANAVRSVNAQGVQFDSSLEMFMDGLLARSGMEYERQHVFVLQDKFRDPFSGAAIREIKWVCDFWLPGLKIAVDTKGWATEVFTLKYKLFQHGVHAGAHDVSRVIFCKNKAQCLVVVAELRALHNRG